MSNKKGFFITTISFLIIFVFFALIGSYYKLTDKDKEKEEKPTVTVKVIAFYDANNSLLAKYSCQNKYCGFISPIIDDDNYSLTYYKDGTNEEIRPINNRYAFIYDNNSDDKNEIILYDFVDHKVINNYQAVKNYGTVIENDLFLVKDVNNNWGIISLTNEEVEQLVPLEYNYIGIVSNFDSESGTLTADRFLVLKNNKWGIIDTNNALLSAYLEEPVITYTGLYLETKVNSFYKIYNYSGDVILPDDNYLHIAITGKYIEFVTSDNKLFIYDPETSKVIGSKIALRKTDFSSSAIFPPYSTEIVNGNIEIKVYTDQQYGTYRLYKYAI